MSVSDHLQTVLSPLGDLGKITLSTSGPPEPDQSLLNHPEFWEIATVQHDHGKPISNGKGAGLECIYYCVHISLDTVSDSRDSREAKAQGGVLQW